MIPSRNKLKRLMEVPNGKALLHHAEDGTTKPTGASRSAAKEWRERPWASAQDRLQSLLSTLTQLKVPIQSILTSWAS